MSVHVIRPGMLTTVQDLGRWGQQRFGVVVGGAMDELSHRVANLLVRNPEDAATLELTLTGASLAFEQTALVAVCGAHLSPRVESLVLPQGRAMLVRAGSRLEFGARTSGCRAYVAVHGGVAVEPVLGSRSTFLRGGFGGFDGRALRRGDVLPIGPGTAASQYPGLARHLQTTTAPVAVLSGPRLAEPLRLPEAQPGEALRMVRVIPGRHWDAFTEDARLRLLQTPFAVGPESDRMGYRLRGPSLALREPMAVLSEAVAFGTIQVPPDGNPIVLMADRQTTGGYPRMASVASVDLPVLAQTMPGEHVRFELVSLDEAQRLDLARQQALHALDATLEALGRLPPWPSRTARSRTD